MTVLLTGPVARAPAPAPFKGGFSSALVGGRELADELAAAAADTFSLGGFDGELLSILLVCRSHVAA
jgi:hypothetical protein